jgi:hypothetical protein
MATKYQGFKVGYYTQMPHHQTLRMIDEGIAHCLALYLYLYDSVAKDSDTQQESFYFTDHTYLCPEHGDFHICDMPKEDTAKCSHLEDGNLCELPSKYKSTVVEGRCFYGNVMSLDDIAKQTHMSYQMVCRQSATLVEHEFISRIEDELSGAYKWFVTDSFKGDKDDERLREMRKDENPMGKQIGRIRKKRANNTPSPCLDCKEMVGFNDMPNHKKHCEVRKERLKQELLASMKPDVLTFYDWVKKEGVGFGKPKEGDNERLQSLIDMVGYKTAMACLNHVTRTVDDWNVVAGIDFRLWIQ